MTADELRLAVSQIESGRFEKIANALSFCDSCSGCDYFNQSVKDESMRYRCWCMPSCPAATLSEQMISYLNLRLGWIDGEEHMNNLAFRRG